MQDESNHFFFFESCLLLRRCLLSTLCKHEKEFSHAAVEAGCRTVSDNGSGSGLAPA